MRNREEMKRPTESEREAFRALDTLLGQGDEPPEGFLERALEVPSRARPSRALPSRTLPSRTARGLSVVVPAAVAAALLVFVVGRWTPEDPVRPAEPPPDVVEEARTAPPPDETAVAPAEDAAPAPSLSSLRERALGDDDHQAEGAIVALTERSGAESVPVLLEVLAREDDAGRASFTLSSMRLHEDRLAPHLLDAARYADARVAGPALDALERLAPPSAVSALRPLLDVRPRRGAVARILARIDTAEAAETLLRAPSTPDVRAAFRLAGRVTESHLVAGLGRGSLSEQLRRIDLLGLCGSRSSVAPLEARAEVAALARHVVTTLGRIGGEDAVAALARLAERPSLERAVVEALGWTASPAAVAELTRMTAANRRLHDAAVRALGRLASADAVAAIVRMEQGPRLRRSAAQTLREMDRDLVLPVLADMLEGEHASGARRALAALRGAGDGRKDNRIL